MADLNFDGIDDDTFNNGLASSKYDTQMSVANTVIGGAVASVVDFGASVYNTVAPIVGADEVDTGDILRKINTNAAAVYDENPDTIQAISLIGGSFIPGGLALKGMGGLRAGMKGANWFTNAGKADNLRKVATAAADGVAGTADLRSATRAIYRNGILNNVADAAAMEAAMLLTMGAHPMLENYWDNPVENLGLSLAFGGVIGGGLGHIADRALVNSTKGAIESKAYSTILDKIKTPGVAEPSIGGLQVISSNIRSMDNILSESFDASPMIKEMALAKKEEQSAKMVEMFQKATPEEFKTLKPEDRDFIMNTVVKSPEFSSVKATEGLSFYKPSEAVVAGRPANKVMAVAPENTSVIKKSTTKGQPVTELTESVYFPEHKGFLPVEEAGQIARANTIHTATTIKEVPSLFSLGTRVRDDIPLLLRGGSSTAVDSTFLSTSEAIAKMDINSVRAIAADDLPLLDALVSRAQATPEAFVNRSFKISKKRATLEKAPPANDVPMPASSRGAAYRRLGLDIKVNTEEELLQAAKAEGFGMIKLPRETLRVPKADTVTSKTSITETSKAFNIQEIKAASLVQKEDLIKELALKGQKSPEYIAIRTNVPVDTVKAYLLAADKVANSLAELEKQGMSTRFYDGTKTIDAFLDPKTRPLRVTHSANKLEYSKMLAGLDQKSLNTINTEFIAAELYSSKSAVMQGFADTFLGNAANPLGLRPALDNLRASIGEYNNSVLGNAAFQSSDMFLRNTSTGKTVTYVGKTIQDAASVQGKKVIQPLAEAMATVAKDEAKLTEALLYININDGLKGWRDIIDGKIMQRVPDTSAGAKAGATKLEAVKYQGADFEIKSPEVLALVDQMALAGREAYEMKASINRMTGRSVPTDLGHWIPSVDFHNKSLAYVFDRTTQRTSVLWGRDGEDLKVQIAQFLKAKGLTGSEELITDKAIDSVVGGIVVKTKAQQEQWNILKGRLDPLTMKSANIDMQKQGINEVVPKINTNRFTEIVDAHKNLVEMYTKRTASYLMSDTLDALDAISHNNNLYTKNQPLDSIVGFLKKSEDGAAKVRNILLGNNNVNEYTPWKQANENFEVVTSYGINKISEAFKTAAHPTSIFKGKGTPAEYADKAHKIDYERFSKELASVGVPNPFASFDNAMAAQMYGVGKLEDAPGISKRLVYAGNAFAATMALRMLDLASPLVNAMSMPILMTLAKASNLPPKMLDSAKRAGISPSVMSIMYDGMRLSNSDRGKTLAKVWEDAGHFTSFVTEANEAMRISRTFDKSVASALESTVNNKYMKALSWTADTTEDVIRRKTMFAGYSLAKKLYPDLGDTGATIFARDFMDRALGNYHSGQRPVMFQGTMGVAMGLFQTYMLTLAQNMYRSAELRDYKTIGKAMLAQTTIFGAGSLPGFDVVSQTIGDKFSDENIDLTSGTFRALDDKLATSILFGLPSSMGPALYTRGDVNPRFPNPGDLSSLAGVNMVGQTIAFGKNLANAAAANGGNAGNAMLQALSLQSISRPLARWSEFATGYAVSKYGDVYAGPEEVRNTSNFMGIASRVIGARPIEEAVARESLFMDKSYNKIDRDARMEVTNKLKLAIRNDALTDDALEEMASKFMSKGGNAKTWRAAVNNAIAAVDTSGRETVINKLKPDSPLMYMMDSLDGNVDY